MAVIASSPPAAPSRYSTEHRRRVPFPVMHVKPNPNADSLATSPTGGKTDVGKRGVRGSNRRSNSTASTQSADLSSSFSSNVSYQRMSSLDSSSSSLKSAMRSSSSSLSPPSTPQQSKSFKKSVSMGSIYIREHARDLCLNPSVSSGPAVGLGWDYRDHPIPYDVITFEETRPPRRTKSEFQLPRPVRERILLQESGVSRQELMEAVRKINIAKRQRQYSVASQETDGAALAMEWMSGKVKKLVGIKSSYAKEVEHLWIQAQELALQKQQEQQQMAPLARS